MIDFSDKEDQDGKKIPSLILTGDDALVLQWLFLCLHMAGLEDANQCAASATLYEKIFYEKFVDVNNFNRAEFISRLSGPMRDALATLAKEQAADGQ